MEKFILKFSSFIYLTAFRKYSKANDWEIDITNLVVQCDCTDKEARFACQEFKAVILNSTTEITAGELGWDKVPKEISFASRRFTT